MIRAASALGAALMWTTSLAGQTPAADAAPPPPVADADPTVAPALLESGLRPTDADRLATFDVAAGEGLLQALSLGARGDVDMLQEVLSGVRMSPLATTLPGEWSCRTLKLGGENLGLVVYAPFACTIAADGVNFMLDKTTGSQRLTGQISLIDGQMVFTGTGYVDGTTPPTYADLPAGLQSDGTIWPVVGVVEQVTADRVRILMPSPVLESRFDILDLRRVAAPQEDTPDDAAAVN